MTIKIIEIGLFSGICGIIVLALIVLTYILSPKNPTSEKLAAYECGFEPFGDARKNFDIHFYVVAILFIIFDVEIVFLLPWALALDVIGLTGFIVMTPLLFLFFIGFAYEWKTKILDWVVEAHENSEEAGNN